jgi:hypothetical protein
MRAKINILCLIYIISGIVINMLYYIAKYRNNKFIILSSIYGLLFFLYLLTRKCPNCKKSLIMNPIKIISKNLYLPIFYVPKKCSECGYDLENL